MQQQIGHDVWGRPYLLKPTRAKLANGLIMETGNTRQMNNDVYKWFLSMVHRLVQWNYKPQKYPRTIWRCILLLVIIFLRCFVDGSLCEKWNKYYRKTSIVYDEIKTVDNTTHESVINFLI